MYTSVLALLFQIVGFMVVDIVVSANVIGHDESEGNSVIKSSTSSYYLAIVVLSQERDRRDIIRKTWGKLGCSDQFHCKTMVKFVVSHSDGPQASELNKEQQRNKDLIVLSDASRTKKVFHALKWLNHNLNYSYALVCDDSCFVRLDRIVQELYNRTSSQGLYWGYFVGNAVPQSAGPWAESRWFLCDRYLPYALSGGYVLSSDVIHNVMINADLIQLYNNDDVTVGVWTSAFKIERKHDIRFDVEENSRGCLNDYLLTCRQSVESIQDKYESVTKQHKLCSKEEQWREPYIYNWTVSPSGCCQPP